MDGMFRSHGSILYNDITEVKHMTTLQVHELYCHKLLRAPLR